MTSKTRPSFHIESYEGFSLADSNALIMYVEKIEIKRSGIFVDGNTLNDVLANHSKDRRAFISAPQDKADTISSTITPGKIYKFVRNGPILDFDERSSGTEWDLWPVSSGFKELSARSLTGEIVGRRRMPVELLVDAKPSLDAVILDVQTARGVSPVLIADHMPYELRATPGDIVDLQVVPISLRSPDSLTTVKMPVAMEPFRMAEQDFILTCSVAKSLGCRGSIVSGRVRSPASYANLQIDLLDPRPVSEIEDIWKSLGAGNPVQGSAVDPKPGVEAQVRGRGVKDHRGASIVEMGLVKYAALQSGSADLATITTRSHQNKSRNPAQ